MSYWKGLLVFFVISLLVYTIFTNNSPAPYDFLDNYTWVKYEVDGKRTSWDDNVFIKFYSNRKFADIQINDTFTGREPYQLVEQDSILYMRNVNFFPLDSTKIGHDYVKMVLHGENEMFIYPYQKSSLFLTDTTDFPNFRYDYIYMKRKHPNQY